jgi:hypothetical protein
MTRWFQDGGWKNIAGVAAALLVLLIYVLITQKPGGAQSGNPTAAPGANNTLANPTIPTAAIQTLDPNAPAPTEAPAQTVPDQSAPPAATGAQFVITGTGTEGLFLGDAPGGTILKTLPEGTQVEKLGEQDVDGLLWFNVREPGGLEGWSASTFMVQAP